jgi:hypothetical protein
MPEKTETPDTNNVPPSGAGAEAPEKANQGGQQTPPNKEGQSPAELVKNALQEALAPLQGRLTKIEQRTKGRGVRDRLRSAKPQFSFEEPEEPEESSKDELAIANEKELLAVEKGITRILRDVKYQELLQKDSTLAELLENSPLALLKEMPIDAQDALEQIVSILDSKIPVKSGESIISNPVPEAGPTNPPEETTPPVEKPAEEGRLKTPDEVGVNLANRLLGKR